MDEAISAEAIVLYTASKFFRSPPFCGAVIVPPSIMNRLQGLTNTKIPQMLNTFVGKSEIPDELPQWRDNLANSVNHGLALRWEAGLAEIEPTLSIPENERSVAESNWRQSVIDLLSEHENLDYYSAADETKSIVSIRLKNTSSNAKTPWFNKSELATVFKAMTEDKSSTFPDSAISSQKCFIGQPVLINKTEAVLRIALGSDSLRDFISDKDSAIS